LTTVPDEKQVYFIKLANTRMPFGKYKGRYLVNLPEAYLIWFRQQGLPDNELGRMLEEIIEIKTNGLEYLIRPLIEEKP
jgi:uncharacterized protein